ncbi:MAG TPA: hypothetical protein VL240_10700 [Candidatus Binatia bacterium]|nr:hypothetical protein [Candidatus Binatia bacterium]
MKSCRLGSLLIWLLAAVVMTITFRMASTPANHKPLRHTQYASRVESQPSARLVEAALRKADVPQMLSASERAALHRPVQILSGTTILPDHSLLVEAIPVVEDQTLTWDPCIGGAQTGAWTFNELMLAIAGLRPTDNPQPAEQLWMDVLADLGRPGGVTIGNFTAQPRPSAKDFFDYWPKDHDGRNMCTNPFSHQTFCLSLNDSPVHLNAIVNRIDVGQNGMADHAGMLRFVFGVTMNPTNDSGGGAGTGNFCQNSGNQNFNIILEYNVPSGITAQNWARQWANLSNDCPNGITTTCAQGDQPGYFNYDLNSIVSQVVTMGAGGPNAPNGSALAAIRTNEVELAGSGNQIWEMRQWEFGSSGNPVLLVETALTQTPDLSFDYGQPPGGSTFCTNSNQTPACSTITSEVEALIVGHQSDIQNGTFTVPSGAQAVSALNVPVFWNSSPSMAGVDPDTRVIFAASPQLTDTTVGGIDGTCNGCHGTETQTGFQQVANRAATGSGDQPSALSGFLVGCNNGGVTLTAPCPALSPGCGGSQDPCVYPLNSASSELVQDPVNTGQTNTFGDIQRRFNCMNKIASHPAGNVSCNGGGN